MLVINGKNVYSEDVEEVLSDADPSIETNGATVFTIDGAGEKLVVISEIKRKYLGKIVPQNIFAVIRRVVSANFSIEPHEIIITATGNIPRTTSGKLQRSRCRSKYLSGELNILASSLQMSQESKITSERAGLISAIMRDPITENIQAYLLNLIELKTGSLAGLIACEKITLTEMGVSSIQAVELINSVNKDLNINLDVGRAFYEDSLFGIINMIETILWLRGSSTIGKEIVI